MQIRLMPDPPQRVAVALTHLLQMTSIAARANFANMVDDQPIDQFANVSAKRQTMSVLNVAEATRAITFVQTALPKPTAIGIDNNTRSQIPASLTPIETGAHRKRLRFRASLAFAQASRTASRSGERSATASGDSERNRRAYFAPSRSADKLSAMTRS